MGAVVGLVWLGLLARGAPISSSPVGFDGLAVWLRAEGQQARTYEGWNSVDGTQIGLRVLPVFDTVLDSPRGRPRSVEELIVQESEVDISSRVLRAKLERLPTLLVLPKWRSGMRLAGKAHLDFLVSDARLTGLLKTLSPDFGDVSRSGDGFVTFPVGRDLPGRDATLYSPQTIPAGPCEPLVGTRDAMVLGRCNVVVDSRRGGDAPDERLTFDLLVDPDLMNNHGLAVGDNAAVTSALLEDLNGGGTVVVDYSTGLLLTNSTGPRREREWSDFLRFFGEPFRFFWGGLLALAALLLWRSSVRFGAAIERAPVNTASKEVAIDAKAKLLRLSGHDDALIDAYVDARVRRLAEDVFGPSARSSQGALAALTTWLRRKDGELANMLATTAGAAKAIDPRMSIADMAERLDRFENVVEKVLHEFGRTRPRP